LEFLNNQIVFILLFLKTTTSITWLSSEILKNKTDTGKEQSHGFESPDVSDLSFM
jgi:hypothetical protein